MAHLLVSKSLKNSGDGQDLALWTFVGPDEINLRSARISGLFRDLSVHMDRRTDEQMDPTRSNRPMILSKCVYTYFKGSETLPPTCYILSDEYNIPANYR